jgi:NitT/TauT family transport system ATP-binding protein
VSNLPQLSEKHSLSVDRLSMSFPHDGRRLVALQGVTLEVDRGELVCIVGASGSGKSTLLNILAGLDEPSGGRAHVHGRVALMFQESALLPWLTASGNVELALELRGVKRSQRGVTARELLHRVHLDGFERRLPHELSGGMRQRVALARALAQDADVLLMDEPFGALDAITRDRLHEELERIWTESRLTILFVTHNAREAVRLGDRVLVFASRPGRVAHEVKVDLPRPRSLDSPELAVIAGRITDRLKHEMNERDSGE